MDYMPDSSLIRSRFFLGLPPIAGSLAQPHFLRRLRQFWLVGEQSTHDRRRCLDIKPPVRSHTPRVSERLNVGEMSADDSFETKRRAAAQVGASHDFLHDAGDGSRRGRSFGGTDNAPDGLDRRHVGFTGSEAAIRDQAPADIDNGLFVDASIVRLCGPSERRAEIQRQAQVYDVRLCSHGKIPLFW
jgi:hypothetical protein